VSGETVIAAETVFDVSALGSFALLAPVAGRPKLGSTLSVNGIPYEVVRHTFRILDEPYVDIDGEWVDRELEVELRRAVKP